jgi:hypothetical protein
MEKQKAVSFPEPAMGRFLLHVWAQASSITPEWKTGDIFFLGDWAG